MIKKAGNLFATAYLLLIFGIYPFFMKQGYVDIGKAKYEFFIYSSLAALFILVLIGGCCISRTVYWRVKRREPYLGDWKILSGTDMLVMLYAIEVFISYAFSNYKEEALWGTDGWYMGLVLLLTLSGLYFVISRFWDGKEIVWQINVVVSGSVFLLGILDRFSIYLIPLEIREPTFISTLGNINWFCGYLSVVASIGICRFLFWRQEESDQGEGKFSDRFGMARWLYGVYVLIVFMAGFCQGGDSIFLFFGTLFGTLLWIAVKRREWLRDYLLLISLWGFSAQIVRIMLFVFPEGYNYDKDNLCVYLASSNVMLFVGIIALGGYIFLHIQTCAGKKGKISRERQYWIHKILVVGIAGIVLAWLLLSVLHTWGGISRLGWADGLALNKQWGHGRGAAIFSSIQMYGQMPVLHKLIGIGPDCFSAYAYSLPEVAVGLREIFGAQRLTNAHNELLTCLINTGILGLCLYVGIFISFVRRCMEWGEEKPELHIYATCVVCYLVHNMVSFAQVLNFTFLFLILGMGEKKMR